jgi:hypothetical protein
MMQGVEAPCSNMIIWLAEAPHRSGDMHMYTAMTEPFSASETVKWHVQIAKLASNGIIKHSMPERQSHE